MKERIPSRVATSSKVERDSLKETPGRIMVVEIVPGSPADAAGLKIDDHILALQGHAVSDILGLQKQLRAMGGEARVLTIERAGQPMSIEIMPMFHKELGQYILGFKYEQSGMQRRKLAVGEAQHEVLEHNGEKICDITYELESHAEEMDDGGRGYRLKYLILKNDKNGKELELLSRFNHHDVPVYVVDGFLPGGAYAPTAKQIRVGGIEGPRGIRVLLHELRHADQYLDPALSQEFGGLFSYYAKKRFDTLHEFSGARVMRDFKDLSLELAASGLDVQLPRDRASLTKPLRVERVKWKRAEEAYARAALAFCRKEGLYKVVKYLEAKMERGEPLPDMKGLAELGLVPSEPTEIEMAMRWENGMIPTASDNEQSIEHFSFSLSLLNDPEQFQVLDMGYDQKSKSMRFTFAYRRLPTEVGTRTVCMEYLDWKTIMEGEQAEVFLQDIAEKKAQAEQARKEYKLEIRALLDTEVGEGLTISDVLQYPRWRIERDAEAHSLLGLRNIKKETGIELMIKKRGLKKKEALLLHAPETLSEESVAQYHELLQVLDGQDSYNTLADIRAYMEGIGATHRNIGKFVKALARKKKAAK